MWSARALERGSLITLTTDEASTSEMSVNFYQTTWRNFPQGSSLHALHHENLKFHLLSWHLPGYPRENSEKLQLR
jgi:hypothetical protein